MTGPGTVVLAFGGNAIAPDDASPTVEVQRANAEHMAGIVKAVVDKGYRVALTHGNGPQVGNLSFQQEEAAGQVPPQPLSALGAMTQGEIGHLLTIALRNVSGLAAAALVSHVVVDRDDPAFAAPSKPIGPFFEEHEARRLASERSWHVAEDAGRGYRRHVPSPAPQALVEADIIRDLVRSGTLVIAAGGGGIPVIREDDGRLAPIDAVIDKDFAAERLASLLGADALVLIAPVAQVALDYGTPQERSIDEMTADEAQAHLDEGQFPPGSMGPKVRAGAEFVQHGGGIAIITSAEHVPAALRGEHGTRITASGKETPS